MFASLVFVCLFLQMLQHMVLSEYWVTGNLGQLVVTTTRNSANKDPGSHGKHDSITDPVFNAGNRVQDEKTYKYSAPYSGTNF